MTLSQALATPVDEIIDSMALAPHNGFHLEPRCRVCRNDLLRKKVNDLLATGASYAMIVRALAERQRQARQAGSGHHRLDQKPLRAPLPSPERRQGDLPRDPRTPGTGERRRLRRGRGHRDHAHCVLRDRHGEKL